MSDGERLPSHIQILVTSPPLPDLYEAFNHVEHVKAKSMDVIQREWKERDVSQFVRGLSVQCAKGEQALPMRVLSPFNDRLKGLKLLQEFDDVEKLHQVGRIGSLELHSLTKDPSFGHNGLASTPPMFCA